MNLVASKAGKYTDSLVWAVNVLSHYFNQEVKIEYYPADLLNFSDRGNVLIIIWVL